MGFLIKQRNEDESDAKRRARLAVSTKHRKFKGNESDAGGTSSAERVLFRLGDAIEQWARALMTVSRAQGTRLEYVHALDLIGWAVERRALLLATLYSSRPSEIVCANILENSPPRSLYIPTTEDIAEFYDQNEAVAHQVAKALGNDETRRRWYLGRLPKASSILPRSTDAPACFSEPVTSGTSRA